MTAIPIPNAAPVQQVTPASPAVSVTAQTTTWPVYTTLFASLCIVVGLVWDISWHRTIGRDTFWSPPHVLEQLAAITAGLSCGWLVLQTTFAQSVRALATREVSVKVWGFWGPLGAWVCIWGTAMMIISAPFDNWWHNAYGLDVKIISPPHMVLATGMVSIELGALLIALAVHNRTTLAATAFNPKNWKFQWTYVAAAGVIIAMLATSILESAGYANTMHASGFYKLTAIMFPVVLVAFARGSNVRWAATLASAIYMVISLLMIWTLQLFEATPKLAPIYNPVTHMVPPPFPYLMIFPALAVDLLLQRYTPGKGWRFAIAIGISFVAVFLAVQWYFADFLLSPAARNFFFAADQWDYNVRLGPWRYEYGNLDLDASGRPSMVSFFQGIAVAIGLAILSARAGIGIGNAMRRVVR